MPEILEAMMVIAFGAAWPASILKSWRSRTAKGKSLFFLVIVDLGYLCGIGSKIAGNRITCVIVFYIINFVMVTLDILLYVRNHRLDAAPG
ncbi:MAG: hypothetical protein LBJ46_06380 [Planctomycetota bacterium]|nr:hypothetical protein [Planctomycetota bacterium]